jgi:hypothetical protein
MIAQQKTLDARPKVVCCYRFVATTDRARMLNSGESSYGFGPGAVAEFARIQSDRAECL